MGLITWRNAPDGKILKPDVIVAKNYLTEIELRSLDRFVIMYLDYAEDRASRNIPMTMQDWAEKLNAFLQFNERDILNNPGKVSAEVAKAFFWFKTFDCPQKSTNTGGFSDRENR